jgi:hypothetical protein
MFTIQQALFYYKKTNPRNLQKIIQYSQPYSIEIKDKLFANGRLLYTFNVNYVDLNARVQNREQVKISFEVKNESAPINFHTSFSIEREGIIPPKEAAPGKKLFGPWKEGLYLTVGELLIIKHLTENKGSK